MAPLVLYLLLMAGMVVMAVSASRQDKRQREESTRAWAHLATETGLQFLDRGVDDQQIHGEYKGYSVRIIANSISIATSRGIYTQYSTRAEVDLQQPQLAPVHIFPVDGYFSASPHPFDPNFTAQAPVHLTPFLDNTSVQAGFRRLANSGDQVVLLNNTLSREHDSFFTDTASLRTFLQQTLDLAITLDKAAQNLPAPPQRSPAQPSKPADTPPNSSSSSPLENPW